MQGAEMVAALQAAASRAPHLPPEEQQNLRCPRCESTNTKFCYYNNYNLSQPRHFCKSCRRYWTKGGALRNIPVGGGTRKSSKRSAPSSSSPSLPSAPCTKRANTASSVSHAGPSGAPLPALYQAAGDADRRMMDIGGSFTSLLSSSGHFVSLLDSLHAGFQPLARPGWACQTYPLQLHGPTLGGEGGKVALQAPPPLQLHQSPPSTENLEVSDSTCWTGCWPNLAVYNSTPGSSYR